MQQNESKVCQSEVTAGIFAMAEYDSRLDQLRSSSFDPRTLWERLDGDPELLRELVEIFVAEYPGLLQSIATSIDQQSYDDIKKLSHKLKGSALQFSGTGVSALAASLERLGQEQSLQGAGEIFHRLKEETEALVESLKTITGIQQSSGS